MSKKMVKTLKSLFYPKSLPTAHRLDTLSPALNKPLIIACSGGNGHISAACGVIESLENDQSILFTQHKADARTHKKSMSAHCLQLSIFLLSRRYVGRCLRTLPFPWGLRYMPPYREFRAELQRLKRYKSPRLYVDLLLDLYPAGYEFVAIFNILQRHDDLAGIQAVVNAQKASDKMHHRIVYKKILTQLRLAALQGTPYTHIISTQPQALRALCHAVITYNRDHAPIMIQQYITDLPSRGTKHFFQSLQKLTPRQQQQMHIFAVCDQPEHLEKYLPKGNFFAQIHALTQQNNPMIRTSIKDKNLTQLTITEKACHLNISIQQDLITLFIPAHTQIASVMLGSLAGHASVSYVKYLVSTQKYAIIFVFRADNHQIDDEIDSFRTKKQHIICLPEQKAAHMAAIMTRSQCVILRCGGLTSMENMVLPIMKNKIFFLHHPDQGNENKQERDLTTGLSWEDANTELLMEYLQRHEACVFKTTPQRILGTSNTLRAKNSFCNHLPYTTHDHPYTQTQCE